MLGSQDYVAESLAPGTVQVASTNSGVVASTGHALQQHRKCNSEQRGQALVEMAIIGMILAFVLLGIIELVSMFSARSQVIDATRTGARVVSLNYSDNISIGRVLQTLDSHHLNTITNSQCDVPEIDIYEAAARNNQPAPVPAPTQVYLMYPGTDPYGGSCSDQLNTASGLPPFDQTTRNILAIAQQGQAPATVGVRVYYRYHFHTPVLAKAGATYNFSLTSVFPLGGDNANNFQNLAVQAAPSAPSIPAAPASISFTTPGNPSYSGLCGPPVTTIQTTGDITTTGTLSGTGTVASAPPTYSSTGSITTTTTYTGLGSITGTLTFTPTGTITTTTSFTGTGTMTVTQAITKTSGMDTSGIISGVGTETGSGGTYTGPLSTSTNFTGNGTITRSQTVTTTGSITTTGTLGGQGTVTGAVNYVNSGTIASTGTLSGQGTVTGTTTYATMGTVTNTLATNPYTGQGTMTVTTVPATTYDVPTHYTLSWPAASTTPITPGGYLLYFVHNGGTPSLVPGVYSSNPIVGSGSTIVYSGTTIAGTFVPYQPTVSAGDYWYVTSITNNVESTSPSPDTVIPITACTPVHPPADYIDPPANFQVTLPTCNVAGQYPPQLGVRISWNAVANAGGYLLYSLHNGAQTLLSGMSSSNPWTITQYPATGTEYAPNLVLGDSWVLYSVVSGVQSQSPATSSPITASQVCQAAPDNS
jgi:hypothetical protein